VFAVLILTSAAFEIEQATDRDFFRVGVRLRGFELRSVFVDADGGELLAVPLLHVAPGVVEDLVFTLFIGSDHRLLRPQRHRRTLEVVVALRVDTGLNPACQRPVADVLDVWPRSGSCR